ncbi:MAG: 50S ribosomal protein L2 [Candidatus Aenigmatarchaeota archaeon]
MGKRIIIRARGKGGPVYRSPGHRFEGPIEFPTEGRATVVDIVHDACRNTPLAKLRLESGKEILTVAAEGLRVGKVLEVGKVAEAGNVMPLGSIPKGSYVFAMENIPGKGPQLCCAAGTHAMIVSNEPGKVIIQMPSKGFKEFKPACRAIVGIPAGGGRGEKPFVKAGQNFYKYRAKNKLYPRSSPVKCNPVDHPFGGRTKPGQPKSKSRGLPPGAKVGSISSRRTGRKKK